MTPVSTPRLAAQYLLFLIGCLLLILALIWGLEAVMQAPFRNPAMGLAVIYAAASSTGAFWARREAEPASGRRWRVALACAGLTIGLQAGLVGLVVLAGISLGEFSLAGQDAAILIGVLASLLVLEWLVIRMAMGLAIRQVRMRAERAGRG